MKKVLVMSILLSWAIPAAHAANRPTRPFENEGARRPAVSPYMNLVNNAQSGATNYQSLVRPQIEQSSVNSRQRAAITQLGRQAATNRPQSSSQGNRQLRSTGHTTHFNDTSRFYPGLKR